jgi:transposase
LHYIGFGTTDIRLDRGGVIHFFYLPPYGPQLNLIEILWKPAKYHCRRFVTWTKETIVAKIGKLLARFGSEFEICLA